MSESEFKRSYKIWTPQDLSNIQNDLKISNRYKSICDLIYNVCVHDIGDLHNYSTGFGEYIVFDKKKYMKIVDKIRELILINMMYSC